MASDEDDDMDDRAQLKAAYDVCSDGSTSDDGRVMNRAMACSDGSTSDDYDDGLVAASLSREKGDEKLAVAVAAAVDDIVEQDDDEKRAAAVAAVDDVVEQGGIDDERHRAAIVAAGLVQLTTYSALNRVYCCSHWAEQRLQQLCRHPAPSDRPALPKSDARLGCQGT